MTDPATKAAKAEKTSPANRIVHTRAFNKTLAVGGAAAVVLALAGFGLYNHSQNQHAAKQTAANAAASGVVTPKLPDNLLRDYLAKIAATPQGNTVETYRGKGVQATARALVDLPAKRISMASEVQCTVQEGSQKASMNLSLQIDNVNTYFRLDKIQGVVYFDKGQSKGAINLEKTYSKMLGKWYKNDDSKPGLQLQADRGIYITNSGVMVDAAAGFDAGRVADVLLRDKAFTAEPVKQGADKYTFRLIAHRDGYAKAATELFPDLPYQDEVLDGALGTQKASFQEEVTTLTDGTLVSEEVAEENLCPNYVEKFIGIKQAGAPAQLTAGSRPQPFGTFAITPITESTPIADLAKDRVQ